MFLCADRQTDTQTDAGKTPPLHTASLTLRSLATHRLFDERLILAECYGLVPAHTDLSRDVDLLYIGNGDQRRRHVGPYGTKMTLFTRYIATCGTLYVYTRPSLPLSLLFGISVSV